MHKKYPPQAWTFEHLVHSDNACEGLTDAALLDATGDVTGLASILPHPTSIRSPCFMLAVDDVRSLSFLLLLPGLPYTTTDSDLSGTRSQNKLSLQLS